EEKQDIVVFGVAFSGFLQIFDGVVHLVVQRHVVGRQRQKLTVLGERVGLLGVFRRFLPVLFFFRDARQPVIHRRILRRGLFYTFKRLPGSVPLAVAVQKVPQPHG